MCRIIDRTTHPHLPGDGKLERAMLRDQDYHLSHQISSVGHEEEMTGNNKLNK